MTNTDSPLDEIKTKITDLVFEIKDEAEANQSSKSITVVGYIDKLLELYELYCHKQVIEAKHQVLDDLLSWWAYEQRNIEQNKVNATYNEIILDKFDWLHAVKAMNAMKDPQKPFSELRKTL